MPNKYYPNETMTPKERLSAFRAGKPYDRIPTAIGVGEHAAQLIGVKVSDCHLSSKYMAQAQIAALKIYGQDSVGVGLGHVGVAEALGSKLAFPDYSTPYVVDFAIKEPGDLDKMEIPDPAKFKRFTIIKEAILLLKEEVGDSVAVGCGIGGPMSTAYSLRGAENLMRDIYQNPEFVHKLLDFSVRSSVPFIEELAKLDVGIGIVDPVSSGSLISPQAFRKFSLPYLKKLIAEITRAAKPPTLHICGNTTKILDDMADTGANALSIDNAVDLEIAKNKVGDKVTISGNVKPAETMLMGTPAAVEQDVKQCIRKGYNSPKGYILALGCGMPIRTPPANIHALFAAARKYGKYPYNAELLN
jgi:uroporphyrinogen decarboxylase